LLSILEVYFDLNYSGLAISLETLYKMQYDDIYFLVRKMKEQKKYEKAELEKAKKKK